ncbi:PspC domain-containing protein [Streptococcus sp. DD12]|uniref:PspC domain-containing protein n=1 Tax=Streptococcus sp. DD12 TaxID=1777880 RepID=UPI00079C30E3|nr:PspC domain-containing protein [Streptococcus sp. DD12]KXT75634.1 putative phage shock protein C / stress-responsive transcriptional regulator [Streptococcus sp. DD12]
MGPYYRLRKGRWFFGVVAGLADKFGWDVSIARLIIALFIIFSHYGIIIYLVLGLCLPYKEDEKPKYTSNGGRRKDAEVIDDEE